MTSLRRTKANGFGIEQCFTPEQLEELRISGKLEDTVIPIESAFSSLREISVTQPQTVRFLNGGALSADRLKLNLSVQGELLRVKSPAGEFLGIGEVSSEELKVRRLLIK